MPKKDWMLIKSLATWENEGGSLGVVREEPAALIDGGEGVLHGSGVRHATPVGIAGIEAERFRGFDDASVLDRHLPAIAEAAIVDGAPQGR